MEINKTIKQQDQELEILIEMEKSLIKASQLARSYELAFDLRSSVVFMMNLWKDFHGKPHHMAKEFGL